MALLSVAKKALLFAIVIFALTIPQVFSQTSSLTLTVSTDKLQYSPGDTVTVFGKVTDTQGNPVIGAAVSIEVNEPPIYVQLVSSDQTGSYSNQFVLSSTFAQGQYTVFVTAHKGNFTAAQQVQFTVVQQTTSTSTTSMTSGLSSPTQATTSPTTPPTQCFIATVTYGSEMAPEVKMLRNFRDRKILGTEAGRSFMLAFNAFYYSFSPTVASYIASSTPLRDLMKVILYPLIGILYAAEGIFTILSFNGEAAAVVAGVFAAIGIGMVYLGPILLAANRLLLLRKFETSNSLFVTLLLIPIFGVIAGEILKADFLLTIASVGVMLSFVLVGGRCTIYMSRFLRNLKTAGQAGRRSA